MCGEGHADVVGHLAVAHRISVRALKEHVPDAEVRARLYALHAAEHRRCAVCGLRLPGEVLRAHVRARREVERGGGGDALGPLRRLLRAMDPPPGPPPSVCPHCSTPLVPWLPREDGTRPAPRYLPRRCPGCGLDPEE